MGIHHYQYLRAVRKIVHFYITADQLFPALGFRAMQGQPPVIPQSVLARRQYIASRYRGSQLYGRKTNFAPVVNHG